MNDLIADAFALPLFTVWLLIMWDWLDPIRKEEATPAVPPKQRHFILFYDAIGPEGIKHRGHITLTDIVFPNERSLSEHIERNTGDREVFIENILEVSAEDLACWRDQGHLVDATGNMKPRFNYRCE